MIKEQMKKRILHIIIHCIGCFVLLSLPILFNPERHLTIESVFNPFAQRDFLCFILMIGFFYLNFFVLIPKFYFNGKHFLFFLMMVIALAVVVFIPELIFHFKFENDFHELVHEPSHFPPPPFFFLISRNLFLFIIVLFLSLFIKITSQLKKTEKEKLKAELSFLRAQINPHFLFNTLNSIYSLAIQKSDQTPKAVVSLSNLMRYVTTEAHKEFVPLDDEIVYINNYINLQVIRLGDTVKINFNLAGKMDDHLIAPIILIPFVENAFKYGVNPEKNSLIQINIKLENSILNMVVYNLKVYEPKENEKVSGHGISITKNRLNVLYPNKHTLIIKDSPNDYTIDLKINLK